MTLKRADILLKELGFASSRNKAQIMIEEGLVKWQGKVITKGSKKIDEIDLEISGSLQYVGRGAYKLVEALKVFSIDLQGRICMDIGASTGGFTQVLLKEGAEKVYALDVGKNQLDPSLKSNPKVINLEETNFRYVETDNFKGMEFISIDVSFITLDYIFPNALKIIDNGQIVALLKPQYEGRNNITKKSHIKLIENKIDWFKDNEYSISKIIPSPIRGKDGSIEYLMLIEKSNIKNNIEVETIVEKAFANE